MQCSLRAYPSATLAKLDERCFAGRALAGMTKAQPTKVAGAPNFFFDSSGQRARLCQREAMDGGREPQPPRVCVPGRSFSNRA